MRFKVIALVGLVPCLLQAQEAAMPQASANSIEKLPNQQVAPNAEQPPVAQQPQEKVVDSTQKPIVSEPKQDAVVASEPAKETMTALAGNTDNQKSDAVAKPTEEKKESSPVSEKSPVAAQPEQKQLAMVPAKVPTPPAIEDETAGFDTIGLNEPEGNWLIKRIWWEKAEVKYEKVKSLVDRAMELRMFFFNKRNDVESTLFRPFFEQILLSQGQLEQIVEYLVQEVKQERDTKQIMNATERDLYTLLINEKLTIEQLKLDIEVVRKIDLALDDAMTTLMDQVNQTRNYEKQSWNAFKDIAKVLDHNKARTLYYSMDTHLTNIKNIVSYLEGAYSVHFDALVATAKQQIERIKSTMNTLKEKGIDLKKQVDTLEAKTKELEKGPQVKEQPKPIEDDEELELGWFESMIESIKGFFASIWSMLTFWRK